MKFKLSEQEKKEFQTLALDFTKPLSTSSKKITSQHWNLFWMWLDSGSFPVTSCLEILVNNYFHDLLDPKPLKLSHLEFLNQLADVYSEHRSDVVDIIQGHLEGNLPRDWETWREHRFITFMIPLGTMVFEDELKCQYDTLTVHLEVVSCLNDEQQEQWLQLDGIKYED